MGNRVNRGIDNAVAWSTAVGMFALMAVLIYVALFHPQGASLPGM